MGHLDNIPVFLAQVDAGATELPPEVAAELPLAIAILAGGPGRTNVSMERYRMAKALMLLANDASYKRWKKKDQSSGDDR